MQKFLLIFCGLLLGCQTPQSASPQAARPSWIISPERNGFTSVVGLAPAQPVGMESLQFRIAEMKARQQLAEMVRVRVQNSSTQTVTNDNGRITEVSGSATRLTSNAGLRLSNAQITARWTDPDTGVLYVLLEIPD